MKKILFVAIAASLSLPSAAIYAQKQEIVVSSGRSIDNFARDVSNDIGRELNKPIFRQADSLGSGVSQILFKCGPDGKPVDLTMYKKSGSPSVDRTAVRAVSKIRTMHPLPEGVSQDQLYLANIILAASPKQYRELSTELEQRESQRIAAAKGDRSILAFNISKSPST